MNIKHKKYLLQAFGLFAMLWPLVFDQSKLGCVFSPSACSAGEPVAFYIIMVSIVLGSFMVSFGGFEKVRSIYGRTLLRTIVSILLAIAVFAMVWGISFKRNLTF